MPPGSAARCNQYINTPHSQHLSHRWNMESSFKNKEAADKAAAVRIVINLPEGQWVIKTKRTRWTKSNQIFLTFDFLPTTVKRAILEQYLKAGLTIYGEIQSFEMQHFTLMPHLCTGKAIAVLTPTEEIVKDLTQIPHSTLINIEGHTTHLFRVTMDSAPPICTHCDAFSHKALACPTKEGITFQEHPLVAMTNGEAHYEPTTSTKEAFPWGAQGCYLQVKPVSPQEQKKAKQACRAAAKEAAKVASAIPHSQCQEDIKTVMAEATCESLNRSD
ncbi:hypothetical protein L0F63_005322 [Massospora cicadina]|nr:hypothetical protein L0F63_005322 [Massospora cicadina]